MRPINRAALAFLLSVQTFLGGGIFAPATSPAVTHQFTLVLNFFYSGQQYTPPVAVADLPGSAKQAASPESALAALVAAGQKGQYSTWLAMWDARSQRKIEADRQKAGLSEKDTLARQSYLDPGAHLVAFYSRTGYVIFRLALGDGQHMAIALKQTSTGWKATKGIEDETQLISSGVTTS